ncbi:MBL fold metallo-hydrolase [Photobacterium atrarenae]|uniref:MBL fold metallo-hydrolase n=1 Tax=Photobacterium atrarenae TaxID=865757 RepID=A0ABY5GK11_9GAMM|nr:MBL fold metallo-hydrolase [Photobacterium atrarenae]UTV29459.1 MBL fold metallo-hydrolase [Photobacterium atrarenae]
MKYPLFSTVMLMSMTAASQAEEVTLQWLGGPTLLVEFGDIRLLTDPMLGEGEQAYQMIDPNQMFQLSQLPSPVDHKRLTPLPALDLQALDVVLLSHSHEDHFDQAARKQLPKDVAFVAAQSDVPMARALGFRQVTGLPVGESWSYREGEYQVTVTAAPANHTLDQAFSPVLDGGNGYWLNFRHGDWHKSLYWSGDSFFTQSVQHWLAAYPAPDIFVPHVGRVGTTGPFGQLSMGAEEVIEAMKVLQPVHTLPIHHSTYALYLEPISELKRHAEQAGMPLDLPAPGTRISYR